MNPVAAISWLRPTSNTRILHLPGGCARTACCCLCARDACDETLPFTNANDEDYISGEGAAPSMEYPMTPSSSPLPAACLCILLSTMASQAADPSKMPHVAAGIRMHHGMVNAAQGAGNPYSTDVFRRHHGGHPQGVYLVPGEIPAQVPPSAERIMQDESVMQFWLPNTLDMVSPRHLTGCVAPKIVQIATVRTSRHMPVVVYGSPGPCGAQVARAAVKPVHDAGFR